MLPVDIGQSIWNKSLSYLLVANQASEGRRHILLGKMRQLDRQSRTSHNHLRQKAANHALASVVRGNSLLPLTPEKLSGGNS